MQVTKIRLENGGTVNKNAVIVNYTDKDGKDKEEIIYFSYATIIGFEKDYKQYVTAEVFSNTTSKYQNELCPNKENRTPKEEFDKLVTNLFQV